MTDYMEARNRPIGITLLSLLFFIGVVLGTALIVYGVFVLDWRERTPEVREALRALGLPLPLLIASLILLFVLVIAAAIGMWRGRKWGWYLGSFWYAYAILQAISALITVYLISSEMSPEELASMARGPAHYYVKYSGRVCVSLLLYIYFFKHSVREYFDLTEARLWKAVASHIVIYISLVTVFSVISFLAAE